MKLFTEEQMKQAFEHGRYFQTLDIIEEVMYSFKPISIPSEEDIEKSAQKYKESTENKMAIEEMAFISGAKLVIDKIQGGNK